MPKVSLVDRLKGVLRMRSAVPQADARAGNVSNGQMGPVGARQEGRCSQGPGPTDQSTLPADPPLLAAPWLGTLGETLPVRLEARFGKGGQ